MSIKTEKRKLQLPKLVIVTAFALVCGTASAADGDTAQATETSAERVSKTLHIRDGGRDANRSLADGTETLDRFPALASSGGRKATSTAVGGESTSAGANAKATTGTSAAGTSSTSNTQAFGYDFWVFDADVVLFVDDDNDGYFAGIDLNFDIDTIYNSAEVYAAVYLSYEGGPWNEYAVTEDFTIYDTSGGDDYTLVTDLVSGYPTGDYDLLIEVFDAWTGDFVASFGPGDTSELSYLPLEDFNNDTPTVVERRVTISRGGGGAAGALILLLPAGLLLARRRRLA